MSSKVVKEIENRVYFIKKLVDGGNLDEELLLSIAKELEEIEEELETLS